LGHIEHLISRLAMTFGALCRDPRQCNRCCFDAISVHQEVATSSHLREREVDALIVSQHAIFDPPPSRLNVRTANFRRATRAREIFFRYLFVDLAMSRTRNADGKSALTVL
jgi:hypothetical protein